MLEFFILIETAPERIGVIIVSQKERGKDQCEGKDKAKWERKRKRGRVGEGVGEGVIFKVKL